MKNIKYFFSILAFLVAFAFNSCTGEVEPLDPALLGELALSPNCTVPTDLQTILLSNQSSINLSWVSTGTATSWQIEYGLKDFEQGTGTKIIANDKSITINNLFSVNSYDFYVRSVCGEEVYGEWSNVATY